MLLFRLYEKVTKKYPRGLLTSGLRGDGSKFGAWVLLIKPQAMCCQEFLRKIATLCHTARSILNRCETRVLLRKDLWGFIKRQALIWADSRLCVSGKGEVWWEIISWWTERNYRKKRKVRLRMAKLRVPHTQVNCVFAPNFRPAHTQFSFSTAPI